MTWNEVLKDEYEKDYFKSIVENVKKEYSTKVIFPRFENVFRALKLTSYDKVKVVILGQDPYHGDKEAHGLSFSVEKGVKKPPSLQNIFKELYDDLKIAAPNDGDLSKWALEGVLLLNSVLTVEKDKPASHKFIGWETFTDAVISKINEKESPVVFILWGSFARKKKELITNPRHLIIESAHPSPFSAQSGFFGSRPFSKTNDFLLDNDIDPIDWELI